VNTKKVEAIAEGNNENYQLVLADQKINMVSSSHIVLQFKQTLKD
jgi:hypothetical protein